MKSASQPPVAISIRDRVFTMIDEKQVAPRAKYIFWCKNGAIWLLWLVTVLLGALATSVLLFTSTYRYYDLYEAMHENFVTFFIEVLPVLWILAFIGLMVVATRGLRATKRGYRFSPLLIGGSCVGLSLLIGFVASMLGFGFVVDSALGEYAPMYHSQAERDVKMWQQPQEGRLLGRYISTIKPEQVHFLDESGTTWRMNTVELRQVDLELLQSAARVRVLGTPLVGEETVFHACGVFAWMMDKKHTIKELSAELISLLERLYSHTESHDSIVEITGYEYSLFDEPSVGEMPTLKLCAELAAIRRISTKMP